VISPALRFRRAAPRPRRGGAGRQGGETHAYPDRQRFDQAATAAVDLKQHASPAIGLRCV